MRNTIRKVMMVVPVLMISCQVSTVSIEVGTSLAGRTQDDTHSEPNAAGLPVARDVVFAKCVKRDPDRVGLAGASCRWRERVGEVASECGARLIGSQ